MPTFTFITDYRGGTYICQKQAKDLFAACFLWKQEIVEGNYVEHLDTKAFSESFADNFDEFPPLALDEVDNVWLFHLLFGRNMLDVHIIQTDTTASFKNEQVTHHQPTSSYLAA